MPVSVPLCTLALLLSGLLPGMLERLPAQYPGGAQRLVRSLSGRADGESYGGVLSQLGDLDGDGLADYAVSAAWAPQGPSLAGRVEIRSGDDHRLLREHRGEPGDAAFGLAACGLDDQDGDGVADYAIAAPQATAGERSACGRVHLYSGATGAILRSWSGDRGYAAFGHALDAAADVDGDGRAELVVGAPFADGAAPQSGRVRLFSSRDGSPIRTLDGARGGDAFGHRLCSVGDTDGDGFSDLLISSSVGRAATGGLGSVHLYSGRDGRLLLELADSGSPGFGAGVAPAGDFDGDGAADLLIAAPDAGRAGRNACGVLRVHSGADGALLLELRGASGFERFPSAAQAVDDLDGDGHRDLITGTARATLGERFECGVLRIHSGADGRLLDELPGTASDQNLGAAVLWNDRPAERGGPQLLGGAPGTADLDAVVEEAGGALGLFEHAPLLVPTASSLSTSRGGHVVFHLDFGPELAGQPYSLMLSESLGRTEWSGLLLPLEVDRQLEQTARGRYPLYCLDWNGLLDEQGMAWPLLEAGAGEVPAQTVGRTFYLAAAVALHTQHARSSAAVPLTLEP